MGITNNLARKLNLQTEKFPTLAKKKPPDFGIFWMGPDLLIHRTSNLQQANASQMIEQAFEMIDGTRIESQNLSIPNPNLKLV